jgi:DNA-binding transcriptional regulator YiaG
MLKMLYILIIVVLVFSIGIILYALPLILYVAPMIAFGILVSLVKDFARNRSKMAAASERRMTTMLERVGIDPAIDSSGDTETIMKEARQRCRSCTSVDVKAIRERFGMSQSQMAMFLKISLRTWQKWEQGKRKPGGALHTLLRVMQNEPKAVQRALHA